MKENAPGGRFGRCRRPYGRGAGAIPIRFSFLVACLASVAGCAGESADGTDAEEMDTRVSIKADAPASFRDACEIVTADDVAAIEGGPIRALPEVETLGETQCAYGPPDSWPIMYLTIHWRGGKELWEAWGMGRQLAGRMMQDPDVDVDSLIAGDPLTGIGDAAHYGDLLPSMVLVGDVLLEFQMPLLNDPRTSFPVLAKKALSRL